MKKNQVFISIIALMVLCFSCRQTNKTQQTIEPEVTNETEAAIDLSDYSEEFETISDKDLWLIVNHPDLKSELKNKLVDAYNASVVQNSIITDFDLQMRGFDLDEVVAAIKSIDVSKVHDSEVLTKLKAYKEEMLYLLTVDPNEVNQDVHNPWKAKDDLYTFLSKKYHVNTFGELDEDKYWDEYNNCLSVPEWKSLRERRGDKELIKDIKTKYEKAKDFDARCIYAIELAHAYEADIDSWPSESFCNPATTIMESLMRERKYSLYLNEIWQKWRVLYQTVHGASKDSHIPNRLYNDYRNKCCCTILSYIDGHPEDIKAINEFLVMACKENILREGEYSCGNQNAVEKYYLFPEEFNNNNDE